MRNTFGGHFSRFTGFLFCLSFQLLILGISLAIAGLSLIDDLIGFGISLVATRLDQINQRLTVSSIPRLVTFGFDAVHQATQLLIGLLRILCTLFGSVLGIFLGCLSFLLDVVRVQLGFTGLAHGCFNFTLDIVQIEINTLSAQLILNLAADGRRYLSNTAAQCRHTAACQIKATAHHACYRTGHQIDSNQRYARPHQKTMKSAFTLSQTASRPTTDKQRDDRADNNPDTRTCANSGQRVGFLHWVNTGTSNGSAQQVQQQRNNHGQYNTGQNSAPGNSFKQRSHGMRVLIHRGAWSDTVVANHNKSPLSHWQ
ncbi:Unknown protein sequence [Pseudomonas amygdali pv. myricae]|nr:Unknown protein sequence [Pseudomonas amygdali pv. myricae]